MKKIVTGLLAFAMIIGLVACNKEIKKDIDHKNFGFYIDGDNNLVKLGNLGDKKVIEWYFDPRCPFCASSEEALYSRRKELLEDKALIHFIPLNILGNNDKKSYSAIVSNVIMAIYRIEPEILVSFLDQVMRSNFLGDNKNKTDINFLKVPYVSVGGKDWENIVSNSTNEFDQITKLSNEVLKSKYLLSKSPRKEVFLPFIFVDDKDRAVDLTETEALFDDIRKLIE